MIIDWDHVRHLRTGGASYEQIADLTGISYSSAWRICTCTHDRRSSPPPPRVEPAAFVSVYTPWESRINERLHKPQQYLDAWRDTPEDAS
jgi:hypothetical protein